MAGKRRFCGEDDRHVNQAEWLDVRFQSQMVGLPRVEIPTKTCSGPCKDGWDSAAREPGLVPELDYA